MKIQIVACSHGTCWYKNYIGIGTYDVKKELMNHYEIHNPHRSGISYVRKQDALIVNEPVIAFQNRGRFIEATRNCSPYYKRGELYKVLHETPFYYKITERWYIPKYHAKLVEKEKEVTIPEAVIASAYRAGDGTVKEILGSYIPTSLKELPFTIENYKQFVEKEQTHIVVTDKGTEMKILYTERALPYCIVALWTSNQYVSFFTEKGYSYDYRSSPYLKIIPKSE